MAPDAPQGASQGAPQSTQRTQTRTRMRAPSVQAGPQRLEGPAATRAVGARLGLLLRGGDVVVLAGDLGAGKTTLVQGLVAARGGGHATSPTFTLVNEHWLPDGLCLVHVDAYRLGAREAGETLVDTLGLDEWLGAGDAAVLIEWGERLLPLLPDDLLLLTLAHSDREQERTLHLAAYGPRSAELLRALT